MTHEDHWYYRAAIYSKKHFSFLLKNNKKTKNKLNKYFPPEYINNLNFTGLEVEPYDILLLSSLVGAVSVLE